MRKRSGFELARSGLSHIGMTMYVLLLQGTDIYHESLIHGKRDYDSFQTAKLISEQFSMIC